MKAEKLALLYQMQEIQSISDEEDHLLEQITNMKKTSSWTKANLSDAQVDSLYNAIEQQEQYLKKIVKFTKAIQSIPAIAANIEEEII